MICIIKAFIPSTICYRCCEILLFIVTYCLIKRLLDASSVYKNNSNKVGVTIYFWRCFISNNCVMSSLLCKFSQKGEIGLIVVSYLWRPLYSAIILLSYVVYSTNFIGQITHVVSWKNEQKYIKPDVKNCFTF